jgi:hypothetical protein
MNDRHMILGKSPILPKGAFLSNLSRIDAIETEPLWRRIPEHVQVDQVGRLRPRMERQVTGLAE